MKQEALNNIPDNELEDIITKEEMNLIEYPISLIAERAPQGVKTIKYEDWVSIDGKRKKLQWIVTGSDEFGLPTGQDQDFFIAIMEVWREYKYKDRAIPIGSVYNMLKKMNLEDTGQNYRRFVLALNRYKGISIYAENALWDKAKQAYLKKYAFSIIDNYELYERFSKKETTIPLPLGYIKMNDFIHQSILNGNIKNLNLTLYLKLPNPLSRRLYRYLDKKRYYGRSFTMNVCRLAGKLGFTPQAVEKYRPAKLRQLLIPALVSLQKERFIERYSFEPGKEGEKLKVFFTRTGEAQTHTPHEEGDNVPNSESAYVVDEVLSFTQDEHSRPYYIKIVSKLGIHQVYAILSESKQADREGKIRTTKAKYFTDLAERYLGNKPFGFPTKD